MSFNALFHVVKLSFPGVRDKLKAKVTEDNALLS